MSSWPHTAAAAEEFPFMDGTFKIVRKPFQQLWSIHAFIHKGEEMKQSEDLESTTIQRQRKEIQFLVTELKYRDRELNDIMQSHQQQLLAWEQDHQRMVQLEQTCSEYKEELEVKARHMKQLAEQVKQLKSSQTSHTQALESTQEKVLNLSKANSLQSQKIQEFEEENQGLNASLKDACTTVGRLQAREEELATLLKLKEKDIVSATNQMRELSERLTQLDHLCRESQGWEKEAIKHAEHWKQKFLDAQKTVDQLTSERVKCKDDLVTSLKAKQERTDAQIKTLREMEASPSSKLQKLLIESRMMINHLEKTTMQLPSHDQGEANVTAVEEKQGMETHSSGSVGFVSTEER